MILSNKLKEHRARLNLSQDELAEKIGVTRNTIGNWETGKVTPDVLVCLMIALIFGVTVHDIFEAINSGVTFNRTATYFPRKQCAHCGRRFKPKTGRSLYCTKACQADRSALKL